MICTYSHFLEFGCSAVSLHYYGLPIAKMVNPDRVAELRDTMMELMSTLIEYWCSRRHCAFRVFQTLASNYIL